MTTPAIQNELLLIKRSLLQLEPSVLKQNALRALELVANELKPFGYAEYYPLRCCIWRRRDEWVLELEGAINDTHITQRFPYAGNVPAEMLTLASLTETRAPENVIHKELKTFLSKRDQGRVMGVLRAHDMVYDPRTPRGENEEQEQHETGAG